MKRKNETDTLNEMIVLLQNKQLQELSVLKQQFHVVYESLKPINLLKSTLQEVAASPDIKNNLLNNVIGLTTGYLSKKVLIGASHNPIKKIFGNLLQFAIANVVSKHSEIIKSTGESILKRFLYHRTVTKQELSNNENYHD